MQEPPKGITTDVKVVRVIDGDTVDVSITRTIRVRLLDCYAPETRTKDSKEKVRGHESKKYLYDMLTQVFYNDRAARKQKQVTLFMPADDKGELKDNFTFSRVLGRLFVNGEDVSELMVEAGKATATNEA
jgi:endonuclease YncB( thermonuclease family)